MKYAFIERHEREHSVRCMCKVMRVHPSGYYAWKAEPASPRAADDQRLLGLLKQAWLESGGVYGYRKLTLDMRDLGESCGKPLHGRCLLHLREHRETRRQLVRYPVDCHLPLLHRLQQRTLRLGRSTIYLIRQQKGSEDRSLHQVKRSLLQIENIYQLQ